MSYKNLLLIIILMLAFGVNNVFSQNDNMNTPQFVSTEPSLKNVVIEEFTGRNCHACPAGHKKTNELMRTYPGRVSVINIHEALTPQTYPNFKTEDGGIIYYALTGSGIPNGLVNRTTERGVSPSMWLSQVSELVKQQSRCNIAGLVVIDEANMTANINVEIYYTGDAVSDVNYLTIAMSQDSVWGSQNNGESNPEQYVDGNYCHMHTLRDIITPTWGDEISPTTEGSLITKTYTYEVPEKIGGSINGVEVILEHLEFIAFVTDGEMRPIMNVCNLPLLIGTQETVFPYFYNIDMEKDYMCSNNMGFSIDMMNRGLEELTSIKMEMEIDNGATFEYEWNGSIASYDMGMIEFDMEVPFGTHDIDIRIVEANGVTFNQEKTVTTNLQDWDYIYVENENDKLILELMQDKYGNETTWQVIDDNDSIIASGGPYEYYFGQTTATELHEIPLELPLHQCLKFTIFDALENGICCDYGDGYYKIKDGRGNVIIDGSGEFGKEASHIFTIEIGEKIDEPQYKNYSVYPNPAKDFVKLSAFSGQLSEVKIYNALGMLIDEIELDSNEMEINVLGYKTGIYFLNIHDNDGNVSTEKISIIK